MLTQKAQIMINICNHSKEIGVIKEAIKEAILEGEIPNNHQASFDFMLRKGHELGLKIN